MSELLIRKDVFHCSDNPYALALRETGCRIIDGEESLACSLDLAHLAAGIVSKLLCRLPGVLGGFGNHLGLYVVELGEVIFNPAVVIM